MTPGRVWWFGGACLLAGWAAGRLVGAMGVHPLINVAILWALAALVAVAAVRLAPRGDHKRGAELGFLARRGLPAAPENARLVHSDGRVIPLELVYEGVDKGLHTWVGTGRLPPPSEFFSRGWQLKVTMLPPRTQIRLACADERLVDDERA
ncbi:MAG: hypothetical protein M3N52_11880 [Actinomycetota bacterium]|nr:hypothetical protein [Actinomycetota bacterium]